MNTCDICGSPLQKAPFSSTLFQNRYICQADKRHIFSKDTPTGILVRVAPATTSMIASALMVSKVLSFLTEVDG